MTTSMTAAAEMTDDELVVQSLTGNRDAFGQIVARYQSLVCSLAYSATGSLTNSEDLAQETFFTAWKQLRQLHEPGKLRSWLCGIARNLINNWLRRQGREPSHAAEALDTVNESHDPEPMPHDNAISREEEAILWRSLERIPEIYREPLVLFYREGESVERVAAAMELSEDAVKQRLSRGRKLLTVEVTAFVEGALRMSAPGRAFTLGVLAALPLFAISASAATVATAAAKGGAMAKSAGLIGLCNAVLGPVLMFVATYFGYRLDRDSASSPQRREFVMRYYRILVACIAVFFVAILSLTLGGWKLLQSRPALYIGLLGGLGVTYIIVVLVGTFWMRRSFRRIRQQEIAAHQPAPAVVPLFEYRSKLELLGLPLIHIRFRAGLERGPVKAWIAAGDAAIGVIFAFGGFAVAPFSFGGLAVGLIPFGGFALGLIALGGFSVGFWSFGGFAVGWQAFGGCAIAWNAALGGAALAREFALGGIAHAAQANTDAAQLYIGTSWFFHNAPVVARHLAWLNLVWLLPLVLWWRTPRLKQSAK